MAKQELKTLFDILRKKAVLILKFAQLIEYEKSTSLLNKENVHQKLAPYLFLILINSPEKSTQARNSFQNTIFWETIIKKPLKIKLYFSLYTKSLFMEKIVKNKGDQELFGLQNIFTKICFLVIYRLANFDDFIQNGFWVIPKISFANSCKHITDGCLELKFHQERW